MALGYMPLTMSGKLTCDAALIRSEVKAIDLTGKTAVVIDVLRATSTLATAFANGVTKVFPTATVEEARSLRGTNRLLGGERGGVKLPDFDLGNSPREYTAAVVAGRELVMTTTNGTAAILASAGAHRVLLASFLNLPAVVAACRRLQREVVVVCAGTQQRFTLEDAVCAGMICQALTGVRAEEAVDLGLSDGASLVLALAEQWQGRLEEMLQSCRHGRNLARLGFAEDLTYCSQLGLLEVVPEYSQGAIILSEIA
ncbi:MAG: 2-phosphosulfolactate phosphatase [Firmicutes bacterium]|nr:2-phosphosulfolactate phosphatase [Bacillota bacterium]